MAVVTRVESQAQTRARVLAAAAEEFATKGFGGASIERIASAAGFTRGAVYSNFDNKADLFVAVLGQRLQSQFEEIASAIESSSADGAQFVSRLRSPTWTGRNPPAQVLRWILLYDEFRLYALRNPSARRHLARHEQHLRESYALAARQFLDPLGLRDAVPASVVGALLFALDHDLNRQQIIDPGHVPATAFADAVAVLIDAMVALAAARTPDAGAGRT